MRVLLTGATGFIGPYVARQLIANRHDVRCLVRATSDLTPLKLAPVELWRGDVTDPHTLEGALEDIQTVVHLVGIIKEQGPNTFQRIHVEGTRNLVAAANVAQAPSPAMHIIFMSAVGVRPDPQYPYLSTKHQAEELVKSSGMDWTILRSATVFGRGDAFLTRLAGVARGPLSPVVPIIGDGRSLFQPVWVEDLARCVVTAVGDPAVRNVLLEVGGPDRYTYEQLLDLVMSATNVHKPKVHIPVALIRPGVILMSHILPDPPLTPGQLAMLQQDNIADPNAIESAFGVTPAHLADKLDYL